MNGKLGTHERKEANEKKKMPRIATYNFIRIVDSVDQTLDGFTVSDLILFHGVEPGFVILNDSLEKNQV